MCVSKISGLGCFLYDMITNFKDDPPQRFELYYKIINNRTKVSAHCSIPQVYLLIGYDLLILSRMTQFSRSISKSLPSGPVMRHLDHTTPINCKSMCKATHHLVYVPQNEFVDHCNAIPEPQVHQYHLIIHNYVPSDLRHPSLFYHHLTSS